MRIIPKIHRNLAVSTVRYAALPVFAILLLVGAGGGRAVAQAELTGMVRSTVSATMDNPNGNDVDGIGDAVDIFRARQTLDLEISGWVDSAEFTANPVMNVDDAGVPEIQLREAYVDLFFNTLDLRVGKQAVVWGEAEGAFITDIVSPRDLSDFILPDFREVRIGIPAVKADWYAGAFTTEVVWIPRFAPTIAPAEDSLWYIAPDFSSAGLPPGVTPDMADAVMPGTTLGDSEFFARVSWFGSILDAEVMGGYAWDDEPAMSLSASFATPGDPTSLTEVSATPTYNRFTVVGGSMSTTLGSVVLRSEAAFYLDKSFTVLDFTDADGLVEQDQINYLAGIDWSLAGVDMSAQWIQNGILDPDDNLLREQWEQTVTFRARESWFADRLTAELFTYIGVDPWDSLIKPSVTFSVDDGVEVSVERNIFLGDEEGLFGRYDNADLARIDVRFYF